MFTCEACGQPGAGYCPVVSEHGPAEAAYFHPHCYAMKGLDEGLTEYTNLKNYRSAVVTSRSSTGSTVAHRPKGSMYKVRLQVRYSRKSVQPTLRRL